MAQRSTLAWQTSLFVLASLLTGAAPTKPCLVAETLYETPERAERDIGPDVPVDASVFASVAGSAALKGNSFRIDLGGGLVLQVQGSPGVRYVTLEQGPSVLASGKVSRDAGPVAEFNSASLAKISAALAEHGGTPRGLLKPETLQSLGVKPPTRDGMSLHDLLTLHLFARDGLPPSRVVAFKLNSITNLKTIEQLFNLRAGFAGEPGYEDICRFLAQTHSARYAARVAAEMGLKVVSVTLDVDANADSFRAFKEALAEHDVGEAISYFPSIIVKLE
jgi:hypothetical protein